MLLCDVYNQPSCTNKHLECWKTHIGAARCQRLPGIISGSAVVLLMALIETFLPRRVCTQHLHPMCEMRDFLLGRVLIYRPSDAYKTPPPNQGFIQ